MKNSAPDKKGKMPENKKNKKKTYLPPKIEFVPVKVEEQLMTCGKEEGLPCAPVKFS